VAARAPGRVVSRGYESGDESRQRELRLEDLLGRRVLTADHRIAGRIEEFRTAVLHGERVIVEYVLGRMGLMERLNVGLRRLFGLATGGLVARWDQIDLTDPERPTLLCPIDQLKKF
jgi:hypothetical protein